MSNNVAVVISGCGVFDGAEINEVVLTLLAIEEQGLKYECFAADKPQHHVINHLTGEEMPESRNILVESARILRGNVKPLTECNPENFAALLVPGGFGVAKNLSDFAFTGHNVTIDPQFMRICQGFQTRKKPTGYMCIAPVLLPKIYGDGVKLTIGNDEDTANVIKKMNGIHECSNCEDVVIDINNKVVSTAAYMLASNIAEAKKGIDKLVKTVKEMM